MKLWNSWNTLWNYFMFKNVGVIDTEENNGLEIIAFVIYKRIGQRVAYYLKQLIAIGLYLLEYCK